MTLTIEEIRFLAESERNTNSEKQSFVVDTQGNRWAFSKDVLLECNVESGQEISDLLLTQVMEINIAKLQAEIAIENMKGDDNV